MKPIRVFGWGGFRNEAPGPHHQTREIVAARSMAEVARIAGVKRPRELFNLCETGNASEIAIATANPGMIFWKPLTEPRYDPGVWRAVVGEP